MGNLQKMSSSKGRGRREANARASKGRKGAPKLRSDAEEGGEHDSDDGRRRKTSKSKKGKKSKRKKSNNSRSRINSSDEASKPVAVRGNAGGSQKAASVRKRNHSSSSRAESQSAKLRKAVYQAVRQYMADHPKSWTLSVMKSDLMDLHGWTDAEEAQVAIHIKGAIRECGHLG